MTPDELIADFLHTDVQDYQPRIAAITAALGRPGEAVFPGNMFELKLSGGEAIITPRQGRPARIARTAFASAFEAWVATRPRS